MGLQGSLQHRALRQGDNSLQGPGRKTWTRRHANENINAIRLLGMQTGSRTIFFLKIEAKKK